MLYPLCVQIHRRFPRDVVCPSNSIEPEEGDPIVFKVEYFRVTVAVENLWPATTSGLRKIDAELIERRKVIGKCVPPQLTDGICIALDVIPYALGCIRKY